MHVWSVFIWRIFLSSSTIYLVYIDEHHVYSHIKDFSLVKVLQITTIVHWWYKSVQFVLFYFQQLILGFWKFIDNDKSCHSSPILWCIHILSKRYKYLWQFLNNTQKLLRKSTTLATKNCLNSTLKHNPTEYKKTIQDFIVWHAGTF